MTFDLPMISCNSSCFIDHGICTRIHCICVLHCVLIFRLSIYIERVYAILHVYIILWNLVAVASGRVKEKEVISVIIVSVRGVSSSGIRREILYTWKHVFSAWANSAEALGAWQCGNTTGKVHISKLHKNLPWRRSCTALPGRVLWLWVWWWMVTDLTDLVRTFFFLPVVTVVKIMIVDEYYDCFL